MMGKVHEPMLTHPARFADIHNIITEEEPQESCKTSKHEAHIKNRKKESLIQAFSG
jgi:hypothetical protein